MKFLFSSTLIWVILVMTTSAVGSALQDFYEEQFLKYPAPIPTHLKKAPLQITSEKKIKKYKSRLRSGWVNAKAPNFAGHFYIFPEIGCGTGCNVIFVADWNTGKIYFPSEDHTFLARPDSNILILKPYENCTAYGPPIVLNFTRFKFQEIDHPRCK